MRLPQKHYFVEALKKEPLKTAQAQDFLFEKFDFIFSDWHNSLSWKQKGDA